MPLCIMTGASVPGSSSRLSKQHSRKVVVWGSAESQSKLYSIQGKSVTAIRVKQGSKVG